MFPAHKVAKVVVFLPKLSLCVLPHFCKSSFKKMQVQFASPLASPLPKIDHFWHKKGEPESSPNTHKLPPKSIQAYNVVPTRPKHPKKWRSKPLFLLGRYITHPATRNKRRLLNYSAFRHYRTISTKPCMQQIAPGCANLFSRQYGVYRRDGAEIEVF